MPKAVKKKKTTYEAFVWDGTNERELEDLDISNYEVEDGYLNIPSMSVYFYDKGGNYRHVYLQEGDAIVKSSKGEIKYLDKYEYKEKFEDA